ncbi:MAG: transcriptional repressor [Candidatus Anaerobiospirillum merdipullorum]|uniref:Transcriptional repressor n=1 Tax=Candidatus Anaerobiospirillum merdipullorum TaxID=2838450 RepID=A0A9E2KN27_9GAMM|nr:transcriptional repressor [Candidatus Anaerobiospirillum merdipullorum]
MLDQEPRYEVGKLTDETLRKLEQSGLRMTVQRRYIIDILMKNQFTSPKELWYEAKEFVPDLGIATVYRLINRLEQIGVLSKQRNLGMRPVVPELGTISDGRGARVPVRGELKLTDIIRQGLIAAGVLTPANAVQLSLIGNKINITVIK